MTAPRITPARLVHATTSERTPADVDARIAKHDAGLRQRDRRATGPALTPVQVDLRIVDRAADQVARRRP